VPVVALVSNKGGAGKTTLATHLAAALEKRGETVLVDADPQGSALHWSNVAQANGEASVRVVEAGSDLARDCRRLESSCAFVIVDCPPAIDAPQSRAALAVCDLALVPVLPSPLDLWATSHIAAAVRETSRGAADLEARLVVNQLEPRTTLSRVVGGALAELEIPALDTRIRRRSVYRNCMLEGRTVYRMGALGRSAAAEIDQLLTEIFPL
jgi:chromosome partitioning protein